VLGIALLVIMSALWLLDGFIDVFALAKNMILAAIFSGIILRYLYIQQQLRHQQHAELQSRIQALHARIRPHFLFNSMNAVASLIPVNPELAEKVVEDLCQLFRVSLQEMSLVSLQEEITLCRSYADIEHVRLGERLQIEWQCQHMDNHALHDIQVPSLVLQPLIENAIYHGIQRMVKGGVIHVSTWVDKQCVFLRVTNPVPELIDNQTDNFSSLTDKTNNHMALNNIQHRLQAHYGEAASIDVQQQYDDHAHTHEGADDDNSQAIYQVTIAIPVSTPMPSSLT
jgi:two-component system sensor histidine kinase AlgZ